MNRVLVIAAHPDDETFGCGGTLARHAAAGDLIRALVLTRCAIHRYGGMSLEKATALRRREMVSALVELGIEEPPIFHEFPEVHLDSVPLTRLAGVIEEAADAFVPDLVYAPHFADVNQDHRTACEAALLALRPYTIRRPQEMLLYHVDPLDWRAASAPRSSVWVDISTTLERKLRAIQAYESEMRTSPHPRSLPVTAALATTQGASVGLSAAEVFEPAWIVR